MKHIFGSMFIYLLFSIFICGNSSSVLAETLVKKAEKGAPLFNNLGDYHRRITTKSSLAQKYFDQGLILFYGFDYGESIRSFREATKQDPTCPMCYWGLALALGSKNNMPLDGNEKEEAYNAIKKAHQLVDNKNIVEKAYIDALSQRLSSLINQEKNSADVPFQEDIIYCGASLVNSKEAAAYANAMRKVSQQFPQDIDAKNLYAFSLFDVAKWHFWVHSKPQEHANEILNILNAALTMDTKNSAANHYYIHLIEQSPHPENALPNADFLTNAVPGAQHLVHMPSHIYFLTGRYHEASVSNQNAIAAFHRYEADCRAQGFQPEINYLFHHNLHFLWAAASMEGRSALALETAKELIRQTPLSRLKNDGYLQMFLPVIYFAQARFGKWDDILKESKPIITSQYAVGMWHYARGIAYAHLNKIKDAENEFYHLQLIIQQKPEKGALEKFGVDELAIAEQALSAVLADKKGQNSTMIMHWKNALKLEDDLGYKEPPVWYFPIGEALGYALLKADQSSEAESVFRQNLKKFPNNAWSLFGLEKSLRSQGKNAEADQTEKLFQKAWMYADIKLPIT